MPWIECYWKVVILLLGMLSFIQKMVGMTVDSYVRATIVRGIFGEEGVAIYISQDRWIFDYFCGLFLYVQI